MNKDTALQQNDDGKWGLYFVGNLDFEFPHDVKDYIKYKDKIEWIYFYKCGIGYSNDADAIKNLKLIKLFTNLKWINAYRNTGLTHGQKKELHKIIKKRKLKQKGILTHSRESMRFYRALRRLELSDEYISVYYRGKGRYKYSIQKKYIIPKFRNKYLYR